MIHDKISNFFTIFKISHKINLKIDVKIGDCSAISRQNRKLNLSLEIVDSITRRHNEHKMV